MGFVKDKRAVAALASSVLWAGSITALPNHGCFAVARNRVVLEVPMRESGSCPPPLNDLVTGVGEPAVD
jgi:hypothetical protein